MSKNFGFDSRQKEGIFSSPQRKDSPPSSVEFENGGHIYIPLHVCMEYCLLIKHGENFAYLTCSRAHQVSYRVFKRFLFL
jgi:hypothetical protein